MRRPRVFIPSETADRWLNRLSAIIFIVLLVTSTVGYMSLPVTIPIQFGVDGWPVDFGPRALFWIYPGLGTLLFAGSRWFLSRQRRQNHPVRSTGNTAEFHHRNTSRYLNYLLVVVLLALIYVEYVTVSYFTGPLMSLGSWFLPLILLLVIGGSVYFLRRAYRQA